MRKLSVCCKAILILPVKHSGGPQSLLLAVDCDWLIARLALDSLEFIDHVNHGFRRLGWGTAGPLGEVELSHYAGLLGLRRSGVCVGIKELVSHEPTNTFLSRYTPRLNI